MGHFINGVRDGYGKIYSDSAIEYEGDFKAFKHGNGTMIMANGDVFEGQWEQGLKKAGKVIKPDGLIIEESYNVENDLLEKKTPNEQTPI